MIKCCEGGGYISRGLRFVRYMCFKCVFVYVRICLSCFWSGWCKQSQRCFFMRFMKSKERGWFLYLE